MIIRNLTFGEKSQNIIISSLKNEFMKDGYSLAPGAALNTDDYNFTDTRVMKSQELKTFEKEGLIGIYHSEEEEKSKRGASIKEQQEWAKNKERQDLLDKIEGTDSLTQLEDYIQNSKDPEVVRIARKRLSGLTGDEGPENPELDNTHKNPIV
jgi:hypothetical protein